MILYYYTRTPSGSLQNGREAVGHLNRYRCLTPNASFFGSQSTHPGQDTRCTLTMYLLPEPYRRICKSQAHLCPPGLAIPSQSPSPVHQALCPAGKQASKQEHTHTRAHTQTQKTRGPRAWAIESHGQHGAEDERRQEPGGKGTSIGGRCRGLRSPLPLPWKPALTRLTD